MSRSFILIMTIALAAGACGGTSAPPENSPADVQAVTMLRNNWIDAYNAHDTAKLATLYTADAVVMPQNSPAQVGRDAITEANKSTFSMFDASIALNSEETKVAGNWAFDRGKYMLHLMPKTGNGMVMEQGKYVVILQKDADGAWKLAREIGNADEAPPPPPPPAPPAKPGK